LGAEFNGANVSIYTLDPGLRLGSVTHEGLEILAATTGGRAFNSSDLRMAIAQARADAASGYVLEYGPPLVDNWEGKFHRVRVTCDRRGVRLLAEQCYLAQTEQ
jgi:hypothetical protein